MAVDKFDLMKYRNALTVFASINTTLKNRKAESEKSNNPKTNQKSAI